MAGAHGTLRHMATFGPIPVELYLHSDYEPDAEYVDGEVQTRPMGEYDHSTWQFAIQQWFVRRAREWNIRVRCELRVQISPTRFRVPDVVVLDRSRPVEQILTHPPLAVFEVLSPEDTLSRLLLRCEDYERMGVANIFLFDPPQERAYRYVVGDLRVSEPTLSLIGSAASVDWQAIADLRD